MSDEEQSTKPEPAVIAAKIEASPALPEAVNDEESPAVIHLTFVILTFAGACLLLPPRQWISAIMLFVLSIALGVKWRADLGRWLFPAPAPNAAPKKKALQKKRD